MAKGKYKVLGNGSVPEIKLGLSTGMELDVEHFNRSTGYEITDAIIKRLEKKGVIEKIGEAKPKKEDKGEE